MMSEVDDKRVLSLKSVVYATDFSQCSENAGLYASRMAAFFSAKLFVAHAFTCSQAALEVELGDQKVSQQRVDLNDLLSREAHLLEFDSLKATPVLLEGDPKAVIPQLADGNEPSMIVLGTHGRSRLERGIIGSVAEKILRSTRWPALTVGQQVPTLVGETLPFKRILFATDFTTDAALAAVFVVNFAERTGAGVEVLNVVKDDEMEDAALLEDSRSRFFAVVHGLVPEHARAFSAPKTFVAIGSAHNRIIEHIREKSVDLLVLSIRRASHLRMEMRTSGVFQIIADAVCPVLTIRR
jgi:nucleotide-binding universal stress UspA family protein